MTIRTCPNCGKTFEKKYNYECHIDPNRKFPCLVSQINTQKTAQNCQKNTTILPQNIHDLPQNTTFSPQNITILQKNKLDCRYCGKTLSRYDSLSRHEVTCKKRDIAAPYQLGGGGGSDTELLIKIVEDQNKINEQYQKKIEELERKIEEKDSGNIINNNSGPVNNGTVNNINNNINNNITNNFTIVANGEEKNMLDDDIICEALMYVTECVSRYVELLNFNEAHPENHNVYKSKLSDQYININTGDNNWEIQEMKPYIESLTINVCKRLKKKAEEEGIQKKIKRTRVGKYAYDACKDYFNDLSGANDDNIDDEIQKIGTFKKIVSEEASKKVRDRLKIVLYNGRNMVKKTRKKVEQGEKKMERETKKLHKKMVLEKSPHDVTVKTRKVPIEI